MAWSGSSIFRAFITDMMGNTAAFDLDNGADTLKAALFNNSITPDKDVSSANSAYNAGQWATANEVFQAGQWAQGGVALTGQAISNPASGVIMLDANDTSSGAAFTGSNIYGNQLYDDTLAAPVADQGICFNYYGGANSVTAGQLSVIWSASGILRITNS